MNATKLRRTLPPVLAFCLWLGVVGVARGQTPAGAQAAQATLDDLNARRQELIDAIEARRQAALRTQEAQSTSATTPIAPSGDIPGLRVAVSSVNESRDAQGRGRINLNLSIAGEGLPPTAIVKQITVTKAVDNLGNMLLAIPEASKTVPFRVEDIALP